MYDPAYVGLKYPDGDVPLERGVCTDVIIRALRKGAGLDLQKLVHEDMKKAFVKYPKIWGLKKTDPERMGTVLYVLAEVIRNLAILAQPIVPGSAAKILDQLQQSEEARGFDTIGASGALVAGTPLDKPEPVFPRFVEPD